MNIYDYEMGIPYFDKMFLNNFTHGKRLHFYVNPCENSHGLLYDKKLNKLYSWLNLTNKGFMKIDLDVPIEVYEYILSLAKSEGISVEQFVVNRIHQAVGLLKENKLKATMHDAEDKEVINYCKCGNLAEAYLVGESGYIGICSHCL